MRILTAMMVVTITRAMVVNGVSMIIVILIMKIVFLKSRSICMLLLFVVCSCFSWVRGRGWGLLKGIM